MISIGIDVSKGKSTVCMLKPYGEVVRMPYDINHTKDQLNVLVEKIHSLEDECKVVMEATGTYNLPILKYLIERGIFVCVMNPLVMKKYFSVNLRKGKTDKLDAAKIANFGIEKWFCLKPYKEGNDKYTELRALGRNYANLMEAHISRKLALSNVLDQTMPGIKKLIGHGKNDRKKDKLADFAYRYWHYDNITRMSGKAFTENYIMWCNRKGYRPGINKAAEIYAIARNGIPTMSSSTSSTKMLVQESVRALQSTAMSLNKILNQMQVIAKGLTEYETVRSMAGVGDTLSVRLIAEIGDVRRFHDKKSLIAYAGIDSPPYESGQFVATKRRITKRGSALLRKIGYEVMLRLKQLKPTVDADVYDFIMKKESEGKHKNVAKIAGLNKFLRIYYARVMEAYQG